MKKDRNSFFQEANYMSQANYPNPNMTPYQATSYSNQGFYAGPPITPQMPNNYNIQNSGYPVNNDYSDFESRLAKLERQVNRLDSRVTKLENNSFYTTDEMDNTTNVYMV